MRRLAFIGAALVLLALVPASAEERDFAYGDTFMTGRVDFPEDPDRLARCDFIIRGEASRILLGNVIPIPAPYNDGTHLFKLYDGLMGATTGGDFDVTFVAELGTCDVPPPSPARFMNPGDESGIVPAGTRWAIMTMRSHNTPTATGLIEIAGND